MTNEEYYGEMKLMFNTKGWQELMSDVADNINVVNSIPNCTDENDLYFKKGQLNILGYLINLAETIRQAELNEDSLNESPQ